MGENPWKSPADLLLKKLDTANKFEGNAAMARGTAPEPEARKRYEEISKICVALACLQSNKHKWQRASVDGLAASGNAVIEIKCGESVYKRTVNSQQVPSYYIDPTLGILSILSKQASGNITRRNLIDSIGETCNCQAGLPECGTYAKILCDMEINQ